MSTELIAEARKRAVSAAFGAGPNTAGSIISPDLKLALEMAKELERVTAQLRAVQLLHAVKTGPDGIDYCISCDTLTVPCETAVAAGDPDDSR